MKLDEMVMLARVMSQRFGVDVRISTVVPTASAERMALPDGGERFVIELPLLKDKGKWDRMVRGYLDHEIGHVIYTDYNVAASVAHEREPMSKLFNVFEDVRIEQAMSKRFPGSGGNMRWLARRLFDRAYIAATLKALVDSMKPHSRWGTIARLVVFYVLYKRRGMADPELLHSDDLIDRAVSAFSPRVIAAFSEIDKVLALPANSSAEASALARQVYGILQALSLSDCGDTGDDQSAVLGMGKSLQTAGACRDFQYEAVKRGRINTGIAEAFNSLILDGQSGAEPAEDLMDDDMGAVNTAIQEVQGMGFSTGGLDWGVMDPATVRKTEVLRAALMRRLPPLLQSVQYRARCVGYYGTLSGGDLHKTGYGCGRVFQRKAERVERAVDVGLLLDISASMRGMDKDAYAALYSMLGTLKALPQVKAFASVFNSRFYDVLSSVNAPCPRVYKIATPQDSTPTAGAVMRSLSEFSARSDTRRILFVVTDGVPDSIDAFRGALHVARRQGIEVYGVILNLQNGDLERQFGVGNYIVVDQIQELPKLLAGLMQTALLHAVRQ